MGSPRPDTREALVTDCLLAVFERWGVLASAPRIARTILSRLDALDASRAPGAEQSDFIARLRGVARRHGYAVGVHGSLERDLDLVAVPWSVEAVSAQDLVDAICDEMLLHKRKVNLYADPDGPRVMPNPEPKPWGRLGWSLDGCPDPWVYVDLSVAPRAGEPVPVIASRAPRPPEPEEGCSRCRQPRSRHSSRPRPAVPGCCHDFQESSPVAAEPGERADCIDCDDPNGSLECPGAKRDCGHHCSHSWSHDRCCWCGSEFGETPASPSAPAQDELTEDESKALRMAAIFGGPDKPHDVLESAKAKLARRLNRKESQ